MQRTLLAALLCAWLAGCGGGDGDGSSPSASFPPAAAGLWQGTTNTNRQVYAATLSTGAYWVLYTVAGNPSVVAGVVQGNATGASGTTGILSSADALDFNLEGGGILPATMSAFWAAGNFANGTIRYSTINQTVSFNANFLAMPAASLASVAGTYRGPAAVVGGSETATVTVSAAGAISGVGTSGCRFSGTATPRTDAAVFDVSVTFGGGVCLNGTSTTTGIAFKDFNTNRLYAAAANSGRTNGFLFLGAKQ